MQKTLLFIFATVLHLKLTDAFNNPKCRGRRYLCGEVTVKDACVNMTDVKGKVFQLKTCNSTHYCPYSDANYQTPALCKEKPKANKTLPGEYCSKNEECVSNTCVSGFCKGNAEKGNCTYSGDCDRGLFCNVNKTCQKQAVFAEQCTSDEQCTNNCACNFGYCNYYYSLDNGISSNNPATCYSGYLFNQTCQAGRKSRFKGMPCSKDEECILLDDKNQKVGNSECQCGYNGGGFTYCQLSEGDNEFRDIIKNFQFILLFGYECHTLLRFGPCQFIPNEEYVNYRRALKRYEMYSKLVFNDPCIKNVYTSDYWQYFSIRISQNILLNIFIFVVLVLFIR